jgi:uncharacterized membrane protein
VRLQRRGGTLTDERKIDMSEIVYVFTNPSMKELIKIGRTENVEKRLKKLSSPICVKCGAGISSVGATQTHDSQPKNRVQIKPPVPILIIALIGAVGCLLGFIVGVVFHIKAELDLAAGREEASKTSIKIAYIIYTVNGVVGIIVLIAVLLAMMA